MALCKNDLKTLRKDELIDKIIDIQTESNALQAINDKLDALNFKFEALNSELAVSRNVNSLLCERIKELERRCGMSEQYSRRECLELVGIPDSVPQDSLEDKVLDIFKSINVDVQSANVEACHRIKQGRTIIKLSRRKDVQTILANKKKLKDVDSSKFGFNNKTKLYINESLCGMYRGLWSKCKKLFKGGDVFSFWTSNGTVKIKIKEGGVGHPILHDADLQELFPKIDIGNLLN